MKITLGDVEQGWQEGASRTHYRVAPLLAVFVRVDNSAEWEVGRREKCRELKGKRWGGRDSKIINKEQHR